jgi:hypothetical protein
MLWSSHLEHWISLTWLLFVSQEVSGHKVHVSRAYSDQCKTIEDVDACVTLDPKESRVHLSGCGCTFETSTPLRKFKPCVMSFSLFDSDTSIVAKSAWKPNVRRVCYSMHASTSEVKIMLRYLRYVCRALICFMDYRCEDGHTQVSASCVRISSLDLLSSGKSETGVKHGVRSSNSTCMDELDDRMTLVGSIQLK